MSDEKTLELEKAEKEISTYLDVLFSSAMVDIPFSRTLACRNHPLTPDQLDKVQKAVSAALLQALGEPGVVLRFGCDKPSEVVFASQLFQALFSKVKFKTANLVPEKSTSTRFELDNDSAILVVLNLERR